SHETGQPVFFRVTHPDERSLGPGDLLDRGRYYYLDRWGELGPRGCGPGLHLHHSAAHGSHELLAAGNGSRMVAGGVGEGDSFGGYRRELVEVLQRKGVRNLAVLRAIGMVPRHLFVPESVRHRAYEDTALPIGSGQTISQPYVQARYLELIGLTGKEKVLEIGTGSGYQTALLALLASMVFSVERVPQLAQSARAALAASGIRNVTVLVGD